ncbi:MAG: hypothetical protein DDT41_01516 [candidate division WS2 bacterium]|nr:hypothetical protein [Candidatus Psychracetigena formicireducens]
MAEKTTKKHVEQAFELARKYFKKGETYQLDYNSIYGGWQIELVHKPTETVSLLLPYRVNSMSMYALLWFFINFQEKTSK